MRHRHDPVAGLQAGDPGSGAVDDPGDVIAKDARHVQPGSAAVCPITGVNRVDPGCVHGDPHLAGPGDGIRHPGRPQLLRPAELADQHGSHQQVPFGDKPAPAAAVTGTRPEAAS